MFYYIDRYYKMKLYTKGDVWEFCKAKWITDEQYKDITGEDFDLKNKPLI